MRSSILAAICILMLLCSRGEAAIRYSVKRPTVDVTLTYEQKSSEQGSGGRVTQIDTTTTSQKFDIRTTRGWVYHPSLMVFAASVRPEFTQASGSRDRWDGTFLGLTFDSILFPRKPQYSIRLHANRDTFDRTGSLAGDSTTESSAYWAELLLKRLKLPTTIRAGTEEQLFETDNWTRSSRIDRIKLRSLYERPSHKAEIETEILQQDTTYAFPARSSSHQSEEATLRARSEYDPGERSRLMTRFYFTDRTSGIHELTRMNVSSLLRVAHRENLDTHYRLTLDNRDDSGQTSTASTFAAGLEHQLYENLTTRLNADASIYDATATTNRHFGTKADFGYTRPIPWGTLNINLGREDRLQDYDRQLAMATARETLTFTENDLEKALRRSDIDTTTIVVRHESGAACSGDPCVRYEEGFVDYDYAVVPDASGDVYLEWRSLDPGEEVTVEVTYKYKTDPSSTIMRSDTDFAVGVNLWSMLSLRYFIENRVVEVQSGTASEDTRDRFRQGVGVGLRKRGTLFGMQSASSATASMSDTTIDALDGGGTDRIGTTNLTLSQSLSNRWSSTSLDFSDQRTDRAYRDVPSDLISVQTLKLQQRFKYGWGSTSFLFQDRTIDGDYVDYRGQTQSLASSRNVTATQSLNFRLTRRMWLSLNASYGEWERKDTDLRTANTRLDAKLRWNLNGMGQIQADAFMHEREGLTEDKEIRGLEARYVWRYGAWRMRAKYSMTEEDTLWKDETERSQTRRRSLLFFDVNRHFK